MLKQLLILAALLALGTGSLHAQVREAVLEKVAVPGAGFDLLVAIPKTPAANVYLSPEGAFIPLIGGELALTFESWEEFVRAFDQLRWPVGPAHLQGREAGPALPAAIYIVPTDRRTTLSIR